MKNKAQTDKKQPKEKKWLFDWSKWSFWVGIIALLLAIGVFVYQTFFQNNKPNLSYEILSNEEVLTLKEDVPSLQIKYNDIELKSDEKNLTILTFRVINKGRSGILNNHYDPLNPIGFYIEKGTLLKAPNVVKVSEDYLYSPIKVIKSDTVFFKNLIIDEDSYFDVKCLIMNDLGIKPDLVSFGKVSGMKSISVGEIGTSNDRLPFILSVIGLLLTTFFGINLLLTMFLSARKAKAEAEVAAMWEHLKDPEEFEKIIRELKKTNTQRKQ